MVEEWREKAEKAMKEHEDFDKLQRFAAENPERWRELLQKKTEEILKDGKNRRPENG